MKKRRGGIAFLSILAIILCAGVAYELIDLKLNKVMSNSTTKDKWCVKIEHVSEPILSEGSSSNDLLIKKTNISFKANLDGINDSISYQFKVVNCGTISAYYFGFDALDDDHISYKIDGLSKGDIIKPGSDKSVTLSIVNNSNEKLKKDYQFKLNLTQVN